jgi:AcrR family transcriptional regulator
MSPLTSSNPPLIRDAALRLFAERGGAHATLRDIASAAGVSPALVVRHFGSKEGLRRAVDAHVAATIDALLAEVSADALASIRPGASGSLADAMRSHLGADSPVPRYLARCVVDGDEAGRRVVAQVMDASTRSWEELVSEGIVEPGEDPRARATLVAAIDLAVLVLREPIADAMGTDPLGADGAARWTAEVAQLLLAGFAPSTAVHTQELADD